MTSQYTPTDTSSQDNPNDNQPQSSLLFPQHLADLQKSGLSEATISAMQIRSHSTTELHMLLGWDSMLSGTTGYAIPYFDASGIETKGQNFRLMSTSSQRSTPEDKSKKLPKYAKPVNVENLLYFPPGVHLLIEKADYCIVTEGEKKAAKAVQEGFPCVAIAGVWNWFDSNARRAEKLVGKRTDYETKPMRELLELASKKKLVLLFDSDTASNEQVSHALATMCDALLFHDAIWVRKVMMPVPNGVERSSKIGLDDLLMLTDGHQELANALSDALQNPSQDIRPFLRLAYDKSSLGHSLHYIVKNARRNALPREKSILMEVEDKTPDGATTIAVKLISKTRVWIRRTITDVDTKTTHYEAAYIPLGGDRPQYLRGGAELLLTGPNGKGDPYGEHGAAIHPKYRAALAEFFHDCQSTGKTTKVNGTTRRGWVNTLAFPNQLPDFITENTVMSANGAIAADDMNCKIVPISPSMESSQCGYAYSARGETETTAITLLNEVLVHPLPALMCGAAVASLLRHWCPGSENFTVHLYGDSSGGKTTCLTAAASIFGEPSMLIDSWRATNNGLEGKLVARNDLPVFLDEAGLQENPKVLADAAYLIGNEKQKLRAMRDGGGRITKTFRTVALSTGEKTLLDVAGELSKAGQEVRLLQIPADLGGKLWGNKDAKEIERLKAIFSDHHGGLMPFLIKKILTVEHESPGSIANYMNDILVWLRDRLPKDAPDNVARRMKHYALITTGLYLLSTVVLQLLGQKDELREANTRVAPVLTFIAKNMFRLPSDEHNIKQDIKMLQHMAAQLAVHQSKFPADINEAVLSEVWGTTCGNTIHIIGSKLKELVGQTDINMLVAALEKHRIVEPSPNGNIKRTLRFNGLTPKGYVINLNNLGSLTSA